MSKVQMQAEMTKNVSKINIVHEQL